MMHFVSKDLVHTRTKGIKVPMINIDDDLWQRARTMYKMAFILVVLPKKM